MASRAATWLRHERRTLVEGPSSTTSRSRGSALARVAAISLAASRSPGELRQRLRFLGDVPGDHRVAGRGAGPVPLDDPLKELAHGPHPLPVRPAVIVWPPPRGWAASQTL